MKNLESLPQFLKFRQPDPHYKALMNELIVSVASIVRIETEYWQNNEAGQRFIASWTELSPENLSKGFGRDFVVYDSLGGRYTSNNTTRQGVALLEALWNSAM